MKIKTLIVDDVELAREHVKILLKDPEFEIVGECANGRETIRAIQALKPDLVFLDVQMPEIGGFDVVEAIGAENMPLVIFVTAYDEFALRAFDVHALDYVLKPIDEARFTRTVNHVKNQLRRGQNEDEAKLQSLLKQIGKERRYASRILIKSSRQTVLLPVDEIDWVGAAGNYLEVHAGSKSYLLRERMNSFEQKLNPDTFARIHRSTIINLNRVKTMQVLYNDDHLVILHNGEKLRMSRGYFDKLASRLDTGQDN